MSESSDRHATVPTPQMPRFQWRQATCQVCGQVFDYLGNRRPRVCRSPECRYKYQFKIDRDRWADYQPTLFDFPKKD